MSALARIRRWLGALPDSLADMPLPSDDALGMGEAPRPEAGEVALWREALENVMGHVDTPIGRRKLGITPDAEWLRDARALLGPRTPDAGFFDAPPAASGRITPRAILMPPAFFEGDAP